jgi:hypothetical protein
MGCDIHMVLEKKHNGKWVGLHTYESFGPQGVNAYGKDYASTEIQCISYKARERHYALFANLAGVRGESDFGNEPRGIPEDASDLTRMLDDDWGSDGHSHSWMSVKEFLSVYGYTLHKNTDRHKEEAVKAVAGETPYLGYFSEVTCRDDPDEIDQLRIVFFFDN